MRTASASALTAALTERDAAAADRDAARSDVALAQGTQRLLEAERDAAHAGQAAAEHARERAESRYSAFLHWSVAFHDSTAASLSWKLTRPLRWLRIGRPKRPPMPDV
ncbi:hypothetical protein [uncultured Methylobacterium sp.]|uniref:hypothetical protein n=1 Tax=uncultured Methylobacterium sp. TaxID=157278 RepID=UPI0035CA80B4